MDTCPVALLTNLRKDIVDVFPHLQVHSLPAVASASSANEAAAIALLASVLKKFEPDGVSPDAEAAAIAVFEASNVKCHAWTPTKHPIWSQVLSEMAFIANYELPELNWGAIFAGGRHGPGASVGSRARNSAFEKLFINKCVATSTALHNVHNRIVSSFPLLRAAEMHRRARYKEGAHQLVVKGSTLAIAPKYASIGRVICTVPSLNMFYQLGLGGIIDDVLLNHYGYCSAKQPDRNRWLARKGSLDGSTATVDLVSASDTVALLMTQHVLRSDFMAAIEDLRCPEVKIKGQWTTVSMVSTMGEGFTFPLQTYIFSLVIKALAKVLGFEWSRYDIPDAVYGVFGDDIIVPTGLYEPLLECLVALGFQPNANKSFGSGPFRESCGTDWFSGTNVRGLSIRSLGTVNDQFSAVNRLNLWSAKHLIPLPRAIRTVLPSGWRDFLVPLDEDITAGVMYPKRGMSGNIIYQAHVPVPSRDEVYVTVRRTGYQFLKWQYNNPIGVMYSTIEGHVRRGCISRRQRDVTYAVEERSTPNWACAADFDGSDVALCNWELMSQINLTGSI